MNSNQVISAKILALVASGMPLKAAWNQVLPNLSYEQFVGQLYDALRAK